MIERIGIHPSVSELFPPSILSSELADVDPVVIDMSESTATDCDALVTFEYDETFLSAGLSWIHSVQAGVDKFPLDQLRDAGISLTNSTGIHGDTVGETVVGYVLTFARRLHRYRDMQVAGAWRKEPWHAPFSVAGERICIVGLGTLGRGIATRTDALGMDVVGVKRTPVPVDHVRKVYSPEALQEAARDARFVVLAVPLTEDTHGLVGEPLFSAMAENAYLINVARGGVVNESALVAALEDGKIAGAALDVFETEPLPPASPLWDRADVLVTPHIAGTTVNYYRRIGTLLRENVRRLQNGRNLVNRVV